MVVNENQYLFTYCRLFFSSRRVGLQGSEMLQYFFCLDDSWLNLTPESLDEILRAAAGQQAPMETQEHDMRKVAESMNAFVNKVSGIDGVEFPRYVCSVHRDMYLCCM
jgi:hypothetical protein